MELPAPEEIRNLVKELTIASESYNTALDSDGRKARADLLAKTKKLSYALLEKSSTEYTWGSDPIINQMILDEHEARQTRMRKGIQQLHQACLLNRVFEWISLIGLSIGPGCLILSYLILEDSTGPTTFLFQALFGTFILSMITGYRKGYNARILPLEETGSRQEWLTCMKYNLSDKNHLKGKEITGHARFGTKIGFAVYLANLESTVPAETHFKFSLPDDSALAVGIFEIVFAACQILVLPKSEELGMRDFVLLCGLYLIISLPIGFFLMRTLAGIGE